MILTDLYEDAIVGRTAALDMRDPAEWPPISLVLERCTDRIVAILAVLESGELAGGWDEDIIALRDVATRWTAVADALQIIERRS